MNKQQVINQTIEFVRNKLEKEFSGHDWWHIHRVHKLAKYIAVHENIDSFVVEIAALLHDISDWKANGGDLFKGGIVARDWLLSIGVDESTCNKVKTIIDSTSFKGANVKDQVDSIEGKIVQDADRLDAIGAIGIARAFAFGGNHNRLLYDPTIQPTAHNSFEAYKTSKSSTLNHFYEKLLLLKDRMNTNTAKQLAIERHEFMQQFVAKFLDEWNFVN